MEESKSTKLKYPIHNMIINIVILDNTFTNL